MTRTLFFGFLVFLSLANGGFVWAQSGIEWQANREEGEKYAKEIGAPVWYFFCGFDQYGKVSEKYLKQLEKKAQDFTKGNNSMVFNMQTAIWSDPQIVEMSKYFVNIVTVCTGADTRDYQIKSLVTCLFVDGDRNQLGQVTGGEVRTVGYFFKANEVVEEAEKAFSNLGVKKPLAWYESMRAQHWAAERALASGDLDYALAIAEDLKNEAGKSVYKARAEALIERIKNPEKQETPEVPEGSDEENPKPEHYAEVEKLEEKLSEVREVYFEDPKKAAHLMKSLMASIPPSAGELKEEAQEMLNSMVEEHPELKHLLTQGAGVPPKEEKGNKNPEKKDPKEANPTKEKKKEYKFKESSKGSQALMVSAKILYKRNLLQKSLEVLNKILEKDRDTRIVWEVEWMKEKIKQDPQIRNLLNSPKIQEDIAEIYKEVESALKEGNSKKAIKILEKLISKYPDAEDTQRAYRQLRELES
jgi:tetratricopeptide (TPR) repeat protein